MYNVKKTQHQNPKFGHKWGEIFFKLAKKYNNIQQGVKPSFFVVK
jgi:hypothetical protein